MATLYPRVLTFIESLAEKKTAEDSWSAFLEFVRYYGFGCGAVADLPDHSEEFANKVLCVDWPAEWQARYLAEDYVRNDPAVLHLGRTILPYTWADLLNCPDYKKDERQIVLEAREFSLNSGLIVPLPALRSGSAILTIAGCDVEVSPTDSAEIHLAAIYAHKHLRDIVRPEPLKSVARFTERERECLHWVAAGKSDWQISEILSLSVKTVNFHIENAKKKFGVATRVQAVALAIRERVILP